MSSPCTLGTILFGLGLDKILYLTPKSIILNDKETNDISFESPNSWLLDSWRTGAWQVHMLATPSVCKKCTFQEKRAWQPPEPAMPMYPRNFESQLLGLSNGIYFVFVLLQLSEIIDVKDWSLNFTLLKVQFLRFFTLTSIISESCSSTKTNDTPFESPDSWLSDSWETGAWQAWMVATTFSPEKYTF